MKIVFANGRRTYPLFNGGDGILLHDYFLELSKLGHKITAIGKINNPDFNENSQTVSNKLIELGIKLDIKQNNLLAYKHNKNYNCKLYSDNEFLTKLEEYLINNTPDILLTQSNYSHKVIELATKIGIKTILFIHDNHAYNFLPINKSDTVSHVIFNSKNTANHFKDYLNCPHSVIYPSIKFENYKVDKHNRNYITMINPTENKGGKILLEIISSFPNERFLIVKGWQKVNPIFTNFNNTQVLERQYDMRKIYSKTKILLVPSQWEEAFARVVPEAMFSKIPVIASKVGGLIESVGHGGILIDNFVSPKAWIHEISKVLNDNSIYKRLAGKSSAQASKFEFKKGFSKLIRILNGIQRS